MSIATFTDTLTSFLSLEVEAPFDDLQPIECQQKQSISSAGHITVVCAIPDHSFEDICEKQQALLFQWASLTIAPAVDSDPQYFHGVVTAVTVDLQKKQCTLILETALGLLKQSKRNRIFLGKTPFAIVQQIFQEQLQKQYPSFKVDAPAGQFDSLFLNAEKPMVMQYQESDYAFISRLLHSIGVYYYFSADKKEHTIHFVNDVSHLPAIAGVVNSDTHAQRHANAITSWQKINAIYADNIVVDTYDATKANTNLAVGELDNQGNDYYEFPGDYQTHLAGQALATQKQSELQSANNYYKGTTGRLDLMPGMCFTMPCDNGQQKEFVVINVTVKAKGHAHFAIGGAHNQQNSYQCQFVAVDASLPYQPACPFQKPVIYGVQTAKVITPDPSQVYTHHLGQVKVRFMWENQAHTAEQTAWVRVMQASAGEHWGMVWIPRVGNEVLVSFENGDIDKPIIVGSAYNNLSPPLHDPQNNPYKTSVTMHSMSHDATDSARSNDLIFNNKMNEESITINAQRDFIQHVGHDATTIVKGKSNTTVQKGNMTVLVSKGSFVAKANTSITLQVGSSKMVLKPQHMQLIAPRVHLNPSSSGSSKPKDLKDAATDADKNQTKNYPAIQNAKAAD